MSDTTPFDPLHPLQNQKALVTGANSGIGEACAIALGAAGAAVAVNYVAAPEEAERVVGLIRAQGSEAIAVRADVSREDEVQAMFAEMLKAFGTIDILVEQRRAATGRRLSGLDAATMGKSDRRQPDRAVPLCARSGSGNISAAASSRRSRARPGKSFA